MAKEFDIDKITGLNEHEVAQRFKEEGYNDLPSTLKPSNSAIAFGDEREPM